MARSLHIGVVVHDFALGGTERISVRLASSWAAMGARVTVFCGSTSGPLIEFVGEGVAVVPAPAPIARQRGSRRRLAAAAKAHFARDPADVVFVPGNFHWSVVPALARLPEGLRPAIVAQVSASLDKPQRGRLRQIGFNLRMRWLLQGAHAIVALFDRARADADRIAGGERSVTIALPALADETPAPRAAASGQIVVAAGRLVREKGFADLIDAFALIGNSAAQLVIVGDGPERQALQARAWMRGIGDRVSLVGYAPDIRPWLDRARLFVLPSHFEGYPAVLVEALAAGRPIVATRCTPAATVLTAGGLGMTVPVSDTGAMARAIDTMLDMPPPDPVALAGRVSHHRMGPAARAYLDLFQLLADGRRAA